MVEPLERPDPRRREQIASRAGEWIAWFGPARLVTSAVAVLIVCGGVFWLVRTPPPATEDLLPVATGGSTSTVAAAPAPTLAPDGPSSVHVAGAVARPGVYELLPGARVEDAVAEAGGATADADPDALNLAAPVVDGSRIYVPVVGEVVPTIAVDPIVPGGAPGGAVDVNRAGVDDLDVLPGVGPATAAAIVDERERNGPFLTVEDLLRVPGIGPAKLDAMRDLVTT